MSNQKDTKVSWFQKLKFRHKVRKAYEVVWRSFVQYWRTLDSARHKL